MIGLGLFASLNMGGCGGPGDGNSNTGFVDPGLGPNNPTATATELTRILYQMGPNGLNVSPTAAFYDISLLNSVGNVIIAGERGDTPVPLSRSYSAGSSVQVIVPDDAIQQVAATRIDVIEPDGSITQQFTTPLTIVKNQTTVVNSASSVAPVLSSISIGTTNVQGQLSINESGRLLLTGGQAYPLLVFATYTAGNVRSTSIINSGVAFTVAPVNIGTFQGSTLTPSTTVPSGTLGNITARFGGQTGILPVNVTGTIAAPSPSPSPSPSPGASPLSSPSSSPSSSPVASPSASPQASVIPVAGAQLIVANQTIRVGTSTNFGINATINGTPVNITAAASGQIQITSSNTAVIVADLPNLRLNGVGNGTSTVTGSFTLPNGASASTSAVVMTVNP